jgi:hypothetical protein
MSETSKSAHLLFNHSEPQSFPVGWELADTFKEFWDENPGIDSIHWYQFLVEDPHSGVLEFVVRYPYFMALPDTFIPEESIKKMSSFITSGKANPPLKSLFGYPVKVTVSREGYSTRVSNPLITNIRAHTHHLQNNV